MTSFDPKIFDNPPATLRSVPFWSLNDWLDPKELARQLSEFKRGGFGGAYLHSRIGLLTEYLGEDWWHAMDAGVEACKDLKIEAWFYDEDKWPSGFAGGIVPLADKSFRSRLLARVDLDLPLPPDSIEIASDSKYRYIDYTMPLGDPWFNGTSWVDLFNPRMIDKFIDCSYKPYTDRYAKDAGADVLGIFTDEPQISPRVVKFPEQGRVAWSPYLQERFKRDHGYDIADHLPALFEEVGDFKRIRLHFYRSVGNALEESFSKRIGNFCADNNFIWTGHYNGENSFQTVIANVGNLMIQYRHMQRPGVDWLGLSIAGGIMALKSLSSVANQYGQERRLSEMFGCSGQNMSFEDRAWIAEWHAQLGVNHICPHLTLYSMKGCRKRDYPPTISPQQPWWKYNYLIEDRMARVTHAVTAGVYAPEMLILHPLESAMSEFVKGTPDRFNQPFNALLSSILSAHRDFDFGDEQILADISQVKNSKLNVGKMSYSVVVVPFMSTIRESTIKLLLEFSKQGATILVVQEIPELVDAVKSELTAKLAAISKLVSFEKLVDELERVAPPKVIVVGENAANVYTQRRETENGVTVIATNLSRKLKANVSLKVSGYGEQAIFWDVANGKPLEIIAQADGSFLLQLAPAGTVVLTSAMESVKTVGTYQVTKQEKELAKIETPFTGKRLDLNSLTLDFAKYRIGNGAWSQPEPIIGFAKRLELEKYNGPLSLSFDFEISELPNDAELVLEQPEMYHCISANGESIAFDNKEIWVDSSFKRKTIAKHLKKGTNTIELSLDFIAPIADSANAVKRYGTEIESIYIIGNFGVISEESSEPAAPTQRNMKGLLPERPIHRFSRFVIGSEKKTFNGNITPHGYPFYAGRFELNTNFTIQTIDKNARYFIQMEDSETQVVVITLNGKKLPPVAWSPWEIDITETMIQGTNKISFEITGSLRNLLGPHHHRDGELVMVGPESFQGVTTWLGGGPGEPDWYDKRKTKEAKIWRDDYHCIPFGFLSAPKVIERK